VSDFRPPVALSFSRKLVKVLFGTYMRLNHGLYLEGKEHVPPRGPLLVVVNHASLLDVLSLMVVDPFPDTAIVVKASLFKVPIVRWCLRQWGAIAVERTGHDASGVRAMLGVLRSGRVLAVAAEGRRTRSGRLEAVNPVLARIALSAQVPLLPLGIRGSFDALPPGALLPRHRQVVVRAGPVFRLQRGMSVEAAAQRIQHEIAALLPPEMQPLPLGPPDG
jgi:1-acyl-sn-glycerol-3-phosphate acyltransferase